MVPLQFPAYEFRTRRQKVVEEIWDSFRKKWLVLTPEEWVRQHAAYYLTNELGYPSGRIALEYSLNLNGMKRRADIVVFDTFSRPLLIVECKAPHVFVGPDTVAQIGRYNLVLGVPNLLLTNGIEHYFASLDSASGQWKWLPSIPAFSEL